MRLSTLLTGLIVLSSLHTTAAAETVDAVWEPQQARFTYTGVTTKYTCNGIETQTAKMMRKLGASDVDVHVGPCFGNAEIQSMFKVTVDYKTLSKASADDKGAVKAVPANIVIDDRFIGRGSRNNCELVERFVKYALPATGFEVVEGDVSCNADRSRLTGRMTIRTLMPAGKGE